MTNHCNVSVYTTNEQTEQPAVVHHVTALSLVGGLLVIECEVTENGYGFVANHRFEPGAWTHFSAAYFEDKEQTDRRPHSRACGFAQHDHGSRCARDCPTCLDARIDRLHGDGAAAVLDEAIADGSVFGNGAP